MLNLILDKNCENKKRIIYSFYYLSKLIDDEINIGYEQVEGSVNVYYGVKPLTSGNIYIPMDEKTSYENLKYNKYNDLDFITFGENVEKPFLYANGNVVFNYDILRTSFYLISCNEEYEIDERDSMGRFVSSLSLRKDKINIPFFDVNSSLLFDAIKIFKNDIAKKEKGFEILLSHDVDNVNSRNIYVFLHNCKDLIKGKNRPFMNRANTFIKDIIKNRHLQIDNYIKLEKNNNAKSEFYFIEGEKHRLGKRYELSDISDQINNLKNNEEFVIGLHTNFFSYDSRERISEEIKAIEENGNVKVTSCRNHYLRFSVPSTWYNLSGAGIIFDSTIGYSDSNGFRAGTTQSYVPYDVNNDSLINIYEIPLIVMDGVVMEKNISFDEKWKEIKDRIDKVIDYKGTSSVLWHQRVIFDEEYKLMYIKIMEYINEKEGKFILTTDLTERFKEEKNEIKMLFDKCDIK